MSCWAVRNEIDLSVLCVQVALNDPDLVIQVIGLEIWFLIFFYAIVCEASRNILCGDRSWHQDILVNDGEKIEFCQVFRISFAIQEKEIVWFSINNFNISCDAKHLQPRVTNREIEFRKNIDCGCWANLHNCNMNITGSIFKGHLARDIRINAAITFIIFRENVNYNVTGYNCFLSSHLS